MFVDAILANKDYGAYVFSGVKCLILGAPNAGKSAFLNALLGESRAIVSDEAGTTRDYINTYINLGGLQFEFIDTAGIRDTHNRIEEAGIEKNKHLINDANAVIWMVDGSMPAPENAEQIRNIALQKTHRYALLNKSDLASSLTPEDPLFDNIIALSISAKTETGLDTFKKRLIDDFVTSLESIDSATLCNVVKFTALPRSKMN